MKDGTGPNWQHLQMDLGTHFATDCNTSSMLSNHKYHLHPRRQPEHLPQMQCISEQGIHHRKDPVVSGPKRGGQHKRKQVPDTLSRHLLMHMSTWNISHQLHLSASLCNIFTKLRVKGASRFQIQPTGMWQSLKAVFGLSG